jgi:TRAP-type C4-dicarboxylate transport system permease small subunit
MKTVFPVFEQACRYLTGLAFLSIIAAVVIQLVGRNILIDSPLWTEELSRFGLLFLTAFGLGPSLRTGDLVNVDLFCEGLSGRKPWMLRLASAIVMALFCVMLLAPSWQFTEIGSIQTSPALGWRMDFVHVSTLVAAISLLAYSVLRIIGMLRGTTDGLPEQSYSEVS